MPKLSNSSFFFIVFTAFLSVLGIGIIIPVIPFIVAKYVGSQNTDTIAWYVGLLISAYAVCQFIAAPGLGALSDRFGRRPILLICLFGSAIGYVLFGIGGALWVLFLGRIIDGLTGGDISTIFAYIADITPPQERAKKYGIVGGMLGVGFMLGPSIGGFLANIHLSAPFYLAAVVTLINMTFGYFVLPESLPKEHRRTDFSLHHLNPLNNLLEVFSISMLRALMFLSFFYMLPFAQLQGNSGVLLKDLLHWSPAQIGLIFLVVGAVDIVTQGFLTVKLLPKFGEIKLAMIGLVMVMLGYLFIAVNTVLKSDIVPFVGTFIFAMGGGFFEPSLSGLIANAAPPKEQGRVQGANQSIQSIARIIGPLTAAFLYQFNWSLPYLVSACIIAAALVFLSKNGHRFHTLKASHHSH